MQVTVLAWCTLDWRDKKTPEEKPGQAETQAGGVAATYYKSDFRHMAPASEFRGPQWRELRAFLSPQSTTTKHGKLLQSSALDNMKLHGQSDENILCRIVQRF